VQADAPTDVSEHANWLPFSKHKGFSSFIALTGPGIQSLSGQWTPPAVVSVGDRALPRYKVLLRKMKLPE
jgi:hypothetical protein